MDQLPRGHRFAVEKVIALKEGSTIIVDHDLQWYGKFLTVSENGLVMMRNAGGASIKIHMCSRVERAGLSTLEFLHCISAANRPITAARACPGFDDDASVADFREFV